MTMGVLQQSVSATAQEEADLRALIEDVYRAHYEKDAAAIAAPYEENAAVFDLSPPLAQQGMKRERKQPWLDTWDGPIELEARDLRFTISGDAAFCYGFLHLSGTKKDAGRRIAFWMRVTMCFERQAGEWRIVHQHESVPFYMDASLRPAFDLVP